MKKHQIGFGIVAWDGDERRSNRYGAIVLHHMPYSGSDRVKPSIDAGAVASYRGQRVRLFARIVESRVSGHAGDAGLRIRPPTESPEVGREVDLGVGLLDSEPVSWSGLPAVVLRPGDDRPELWIDPRKLYVIHDQTVELSVAPTDDDFTPAPVIVCSEGAFDNGDGSFQFKKVTTPGTIEPTITKVGDGLFVLEPPTSIPGSFGRRLPYRPSK
jgi:hypothetical protein